MSVLRDEPFPLNPFRFASFSHITNMTNLNQSHLTDCMGQVVGKEDPMDIVTKTGQSSKRLSLYIKGKE
ncbi:hypothetical protein PIB30_016413 [Stylosanthes scabra]|uniref:Uncharacterized protein n=1 Tax=Stylosanthes scabra TaxID=79078 RepID=A0ABU6V5K9_9FABA|nr:hypothetical protein [Stylosanthes scabra]